MLSGLGHGSVGCCNDEDRAVHLSSAGNHVLNIVGVARAVNVRIVTVSGLILDVSGVNCDTTRLLFGCLVDFVVSHLLRFAFESRKGHGDSGGKSGFAVVNVTDGTDVNVGFCFCQI